MQDREKEQERERKRAEKEKEREERKLEKERSRAGGDRDETDVRGGEGNKRDRVLSGRRTLAAADDSEPAGGLVISPRAVEKSSREKLERERDREKEKERERENEREKESSRVEREKEKSLKREKESRETLKGAFRSVYIARARPSLAGPASALALPVGAGAGTPAASNVYTLAPNELSSLLLRVCIHKDKKKRTFRHRLRALLRTSTRALLVRSMRFS